MPSWVAATLVAVLVATVPMAWVLGIMRDLPDPLVGSHRRWPGWANSLVIGLVTLSVTVFIRFAYYGATPEPLRIGFQLLIVSVAYVFGMVLLVRQFEGLYPEYFVTTGRSGLTVRKAAYRNVSGIEALREAGGETLLRIEMNSGRSLRLELPTRDLPVLFQAIERNKPAL